MFTSPLGMTLVLACFAYGAHPLINGAGLITLQVLVLIGCSAAELETVAPVAPE
jgi:hypothetical protein